MQKIQTEPKKCGNVFLQVLTFEDDEVNNSDGSDSFFIFHTVIQATRITEQTNKKHIKLSKQRLEMFDKDCSRIHIEWAKQTELFSLEDGLSFILHNSSITKQSFSCSSISFNSIWRSRDYKAEVLSSFSLSPLPPVNKNRPK